MNRTYTFNHNGVCLDPDIDKYYALGWEVDIRTAYSEKLQRWLAGWRFNWGDSGYASPCMEATDTPYVPPHYKTQNAARRAALDLAIKEFKDRATRAFMDKLIAARIQASIENLF